MRFDKKEMDALIYALKNFKGKVYVFGSRLDDTKKGGDIDIMIVPNKKINALKLPIEIQRRFFSRCEQKLDVIVFKEDNPFCREVMNRAERIDIKTKQ
jgi:predicted nucleotidyltransferase